ncbi:hypothetical protein RP20_CCG014338 [Aedes albopictus]|nr:hypothetical protein RP20_CCG014338 [Aedes albopictus]
MKVEEKSGIRVWFRVKPSSPTLHTKTGRDCPALEPMPKVNRSGIFAIVRRNQLLHHDQPSRSDIHFPNPKATHQSQEQEYRKCEDNL